MPSACTLSCSEPRALTIDRRSIPLRVVRGRSSVDRAATLWVRIDGFSCFGHFAPRAAPLPGPRCRRPTTDADTLLSLVAHETATEAAFGLPLDRAASSLPARRCPPTGLRDVAF
jgi:hypothetical protein